MKLRQSFTDFIFSTNTDGSGKAASYVRALDMLGPILIKWYQLRDANIPKIGNAYTYYRQFSSVLNCMLVDKFEW